MAWLWRAWSGWPGAVPWLSALADGRRAGRGDPAQVGARRQPVAGGWCGDGGQRIARVLYGEAASAQIFCIGLAAAGRAGRGPPGRRGTGDQDARTPLDDLPAGFKPLRAARLRVRPDAFATKQLALRTVGRSSLHVTQYRDRGDASEQRDDPKRSFAWP